MSLSVNRYPEWLEELIEQTGNYSLYEAYENLLELLPEHVEAQDIGLEEEEKVFTKDEMMLYLIANSNFFLFG